MNAREPVGQKEVFVWPACIFVWAQALTGMCALFTGYDTGFYLAVDNIILLIAIGMSVVVVLGRRRGEFDKPTPFARPIEAVFVVVSIVVGLGLAVTGTFGFVDARPGPVGGTISMLGGLALVVIGVRTLVGLFRAPNGVT